MEFDLYLNTWKKLRAVRLFEIEATRPHEILAAWAKELGASSARQQVI